LINAVEKRLNANWRRCIKCLELSRHGVRIVARPVLLLRQRKSMFER
jgi:hypothetical protein